MEEHLKLAAVLSRIDGGLPPDATPLDCLAWAWQCHLRFWAFR